MKKILPIAISATLLIGLAAQTLDVQLQRAIQKEAATGDLKAAIDEYKKIAVRAGSNHAAAAQALLHEADAHQKLGDAEARKIYEQIVRQYADQKEAAAMAQSHLSGTKTNGMVNRPVWESHAGSNGSVSSDGRYISFTDWEGDSNDLMIHDLVTGTDRRLTKASKGDYVDESAFSPDGKQIAYIWGSKDGAGLRVLSLTGNGSAAPRIFKNADWEYDTIAWSPDGKLLATYAGPKGKPWKTVLVSVQDGSTRVLAEAAGSLIFSPDGKYLACDRVTNGPGTQKDIFIIDVASGRETPAVVYPSEEEVMGWSKDGRLLFASDRSGSMGLWALSMSDGKPRGEAVQVKADIGNGYSHGMTSSGALYYAANTGGSQPYLEVAPFDFGAGKILSPSAPAGTASQLLQVIEQFDWSPDGEHLAYTTLNSTLGRRRPVIAIRSTKTGLNRIVLTDSVLLNAQVRWAPDSRTLLVTGFGEIHLIDTQTEKLSTFKADAAVGSQVLIDMPRWSPDQKKIYFRIPSTNSVAFFESDPDLKNPREIIRRPILGGLNLTPDGSTIITPTGPDGAGVIAIPVAGGAPKELINRVDLGNVFISPDGKYVGQVSATPRVGYNSASIIPIGGGERRELFTAEPPFVVSMGMWDPDSKSMFLKKSTADGKQTEIWRAPIGGGPAVKLDTGLNLDQITRFFTPSPTGREIAYVRGTRTPGKSEVWVLENFLPPVK